MRKFDTKVQYLKYKVLREVARQEWNGTLQENVLDIPKTIVPGKEATMRCCVYKERAILSERVKLAMGLTMSADPNDKSVIQVIDIACDECPVGGFEVTEACRGCLAHRCEDVCKRGAISFDHHQKAHIDKSKCVECGMCTVNCPFGAISDKSQLFQLILTHADGFQIGKTACFIQHGEQRLQHVRCAVKQCAHCRDRHYIRRKHPVYTQCIIGVGHLIIRKDILIAYLSLIHI